MPRHARIVAAGFPMHAILRGIDRTAIFFAESDYRAFLDALVGLAASESVRVHAYVLMTNHIHLPMTPESDRGSSLLMKGLGQRYVQYVNRAYRRSGTLFEGRFRSSVIEADSYLLACQRYIELNPVRANMVRAPGDYPWSSYRCNALGGADPIVAAHPRLPRLGRDRGSPTLDLSRLIRRPDTGGYARCAPGCDERRVRFGQSSFPATDRSDGGPAHMARKVRPTEETTTRSESARSTAVTRKPWSVPGIRSRIKSTLAPLTLAPLTRIIK